MLHNGFELSIQEIREHGYLSDQELTEICRVPQQVQEDGMTVRDILSLDGLPNRTSLAHKNSVFLVPVEDLKKLTAKGQEDFVALLEVRVTVIRVDDRFHIPTVAEGLIAYAIERQNGFERHQQKGFPPS